MPYLYLLVSVFTFSSTSVFGKFFNRTTIDKKFSDVLYNLILSLSAFIGWAVLFVIDFSFEPTVLLYSALMGICFSLCNLFTILALKHGSATLTSLFVSLSLIMTTIWGLLFWNAKTSVFVFIGLFLVAVSIFLCLYSNKKEEKSFSWKWLLYACLAMFCNFACTVAQRTQQMQFNGKHGNMLMFFAMLLSVIIFLVVGLKNNKSEFVSIHKKGWWMPFSAGICNVMLNVFVMLLAVSPISPSVVYPTISIGGLAVVSIFSLTVFKEKLFWWQWIGFIVGAIAILFLSI